MLTCKKRYTVITASTLPSQAHTSPARIVGKRGGIHAVGPVWQGGAKGEPELLVSAYRSALAIAGAEQLQSIAFPAISTGIYGYPLQAATKIAVATVREALGKRETLTDAIFACFGTDVLEAYGAEGIAEGRI